MTIRMLHWLAGLLLLVPAPSALLSAAAPTAPAPLAEDRSALEAATRAVCKKQVVLLGEPSHGVGHSDAFRAALVAQLVERCGFRAVLFESSFYEWVPLWRSQQAGAAVSPEAVGTAVGGLWSFNREVQPLLAYLAKRASGGLFVGGIDFQLGGLGQDYTNAGVIAELTERLEPERASLCRNTVRAWVYEGPSEERRLALAPCFDAIEKALTARSARPDWMRLAMLDNLEAYTATGLDKGSGAYIAARDKRMFENLQVIRSHLPGGTKVVIWTHNAHAANRADEQAGFEGIDNLGSLVARAYGPRSFALAISAFSGTFRAGREHREKPAAPANSIEFRLFGNQAGASVFLGTAALRKFGFVPSAVFNHDYHAARWWQRFNGMVVFHSEHAAFSSRYGN